MSNLKKFLKILDWILLGDERVLKMGFRKYIF